MHGHCLPVGPTFYGLAIYTIICDVAMVFLPIPLLLRLKIKPAQKAGVVCLFLLGLFTTICSILRLSQIHRVAWGDGNSTMLVLWGTIEFNIGVRFAPTKPPTSLLATLLCGVQTYQSGRTNLNQVGTNQQEANAGPLPPSCEVEYRHLYPIPRPSPSGGCSRLPIHQQQKVLR